MKEEIKKEILLALENIKDKDPNSYAVFDYETFLSKSITFQDKGVTIKIEISEGK